MATRNIGQYFSGYSFKGNFLTTEYTFFLLFDMNYETDFQFLSTREKVDRTETIVKLYCNIPLFSTSKFNMLTHILVRRAAKIMIRSKF